MRRAFLHGFAGDPAIWAGIAHAGDDICVALPGHGPTPVQPTWDANLDAVAKAMGPCDVAVGYSLGARVALGLVATNRVARAILISVNPGLSYADSLARRESDAVWVRMLREQGIAAFAEAWEAQPLFATQRERAPADRLAARRMRRLALDAGQLARSLEVMGLGEMPDYRDAVTADRCRLICGGDDAKFLAIARSLDAPLTVIPDCGHDPTLERPAMLAMMLAR